MGFDSTGILNCWVFTPQRFLDDRGYFQETFKLSRIHDDLGVEFHVKQINQSKSAAGVVRGIHWADVPPGQAKYVSVARGEIIDFVVDLRSQSPTFGKWKAFNLSESNGRVVLIGNGLGHAFLSLEDETVVTYFCSEEFNPAAERTLNPLDETVSIPFSAYASSAGLGQLSFSPKDAAGPNLQDLLEAGILPINS
jgi:dTDP-4-dehydrorhamnose 3,5-epimerase